MHIQKTSLKVETEEVAIRGNSIECNLNSSSYKALRVADKSWVIFSSNKEIDDLIEKAKKIASEGEGVNLAEARLAVGDFKFKEGFFEQDYAIDLLKDLRANFEGLFEAILTYEKTFREIKTSDGADAREIKEITDLNLSVAEKRTASLHVGGIGGVEIVEEKFDFIVEEVKSRFENLKRARILNPFMRGFKFDVILTKESACAFVHEVTHMLEADVLSEEIESGKEITVFDDPFGFGGYHFDDEGVIAERKCRSEAASQNINFKYLPLP